MCLFEIFAIVTEITGIGILFYLYERFHLHNVSYYLEYLYIRRFVFLNNFKYKLLNADFASFSLFEIESYSCESMENGNFKLTASFISSLSHAAHDIVEEQLHDLPERRRNTSLRSTRLYAAVHGGGDHFGSRPRHHHFHAFHTVSIFQYLRKKYFLGGSLLNLQISCLILYNIINLSRKSQSRVFHQY